MRTTYVHDELTQRIIGCAITVHQMLGPGFLESTYEAALCIELAEQGSVRRGVCR